MYSTCLFCNASLDSNESIEHFPVGRRLAFDPAKGRLWVVCRKCERWNLSPLEERWEAIEECERLFRDTRLRVSTDNIGLAKLREGLELVRIGEPQRPEFAAWRYGDQFGRRRRIRIARAALGVGALGAVFVGGAVVGASLGGATWLFWRWAVTVVQGNPDAVVARLAHEKGRLDVRREDLKQLELLRGGGDDPMRLSITGRQRTIVLSGAEAARAAGVLMPHINQYGATRPLVQEAVARIESAGAAEYFLRRTIAGSFPADAAKFPVQKLSTADRLAFEMALHEESERRALEGELAALELAWREAEEIAAISDNLLVPSRVQELVGRLSGRG